MGLQGLKPQPSGEEKRGQGRDRRQMQMFSNLQGKGENAKNRPNYPVGGSKGLCGGGEPLVGGGVMH